MKYVVAIVFTCLVVAAGMWLWSLPTGSSTIYQSAGFSPVSGDNTFAELNYRRSVAGLRALPQSQYLQRAAQNFAELMARNQSDVTPTANVSIISLIDRSAYPIDPTKRETAWILLKTSPTSTIGQALDQQDTNSNGVSKQVLTWPEARSVGVGTSVSAEDGFTYTAILFGIY